MNELIEYLQLGGHATSFEGLHPRAQAAAEQAQSTLESLLHMDGIERLGAGTVQELVGDAFYSAIDRTGNRATEAGYAYIPEMRSIGGFSKQWEDPTPKLLAVPSKTSGRAAVVVILFNGLNARGWGDLETADAYVEGIYDDALTANRRVVDLFRASQTLAALVDEADRLEREAEGEHQPDRGPAF